MGSQVFLGLIFGKVGTVSGVLVDHADELRSLTYSRSLEKEADLKGLKILTDRGIDPQGFVDLFDRLGSAAGSDVVPEFMASHPDLENRIGYIKESSKGLNKRPQPLLDTIFAQLKP
jgi:predicted Zn-dependent protease